jgi:hypothetical protein
VYKFLYIFIFSTLLNSQPLFSQETDLVMSVGTSFNSKNTLGFYNNLRAQNKSNINFNLKYSKRSLSSQLSLNFDDHDKLSFDNSYIDYEKGIANLSIGKVDRIWSFSKKSSLILSSNSRPLEAFSIKLKNKFNTQWLPSTAKWSVELINSTTKNSLNIKNSMLSGARVVISPSEKLNFEFIKIAQWGNQHDKLYSINFNSLFPIETNTGRHAYINKMAGFGITYTVPVHEYNMRLYSQAIGEDEAGGLPSCFAWMMGLELAAPKMKFPTTLSIEAIDTRIKKSTNGFCGANFMYNNNTYDYINYDIVLGAPIDTEGTSLELFGQSHINKNLIINYSTKFLSINDKNYSQHRLSSIRSLGTITSLGIHWEKDGFDLGGNIGYQSIILDKANISKGTIFGLYASVEF